MPFLPKFNYPKSGLEEEEEVALRRFLRHLKKENEMNFYIDSFNFENKLITLLISMNCTMFKATKGNNKV